MSGEPMWRKVCEDCGEVLGGAIVVKGNEAGAVEFLGDRPGTRLERLVPGDEGYPVKIGRLCIHHGGKPDAAQGALFGGAS